MASGGAIKARPSTQAMTTACTLLPPQPYSTTTAPRIPTQALTTVTSTRAKLNVTDQGRTRGVYRDNSGAGSTKHGLGAPPTLPDTVVTPEPYPYPRASLAAEHPPLKSPALGGSVRCCERLGDLYV